MRNAIFPPHLITVSVNMEHYASFPVIPACLAVPLLVYNLSKLPLAVIRYGIMPPLASMVLVI